MRSELLLAGRAVETGIRFTGNEDLGKQIIPTTAGSSKILQVPSPLHLISFRLDRLHSMVTHF